MEHGGGVTMSGGNAIAQKLGYNNREYEQAVGYNMNEMDWRHYDPAIGRFNCIDKLAEISYSNSPYVFSNNNPIIFTDPSGLTSNNFSDYNWETGEYASGSLDAALKKVDPSDIANMDADADTTELIWRAMYESLFGDGDGNGGGQPSYIPPPKELPGFPGAIKLKNQKGNRPAWRLPDGSLAEWDSQHGELEVYDKTGKKHKGAYDPETGEKKPGSEVSGRKANRSKFNETPTEITIESTQPYKVSNPFRNATIPQPSTQQAVTIGTILIIALVIIFSPVGA